MKGTYLHEPDQRPQIAGLYKELYTPVANQRITSTQLGGKFLRYCKLLLTTAANVTYRTVGGSLVTTEAIPINTVYDVLITEIHSCSAGTPYIIHDGALDPGFDGQ